jgi:nucleoside 2-deoxyribosyltransferase
VVYLAGPINGCDDATAKDWREYAKARLLCETLDPMRRDFRGREHEPGIADEIVEGDKKDIDDSYALLVNASVPSTGTSMEVLYAWERSKVVVSVYTSDRPPSPWLAYHSDAVFGSLDEAIQFLNGMVNALDAERQAGQT